MLEADVMPMSTVELQSVLPNVMASVRASLQQSEEKISAFIAEEHLEPVLSSFEGLIAGYILKSYTLDQAKTALDAEIILFFRWFGGQYGFVIGNLLSPIMTEWANNLIAQAYAQVAQIANERQAAIKAADSEQSASEDQASDAVPGLNQV